MKQSGSLCTLTMLLLCLYLQMDAIGQLQTRTAVLQQAARVQADKETENFRQLLRLSKSKGWKMMFTTKNGGVARLEGVDAAGNPIYVTTFNNITAAATIQTNQLWQGGSTGLNLSGSSANLRGKIGIWDEGRVRSTHVEMVNRILQKGSATANGDHATHVAGTMIAAGVNPLIRGMAYGAQQLIAYSEFSNDVSGMLTEAPGLLVSNHSYGTIAGWYNNTTENRWEFHGEASANEDYKFGFYGDKALLYDSISYNAPNYLIVFSAGNNRNDNGPAVGQPYWRFNATGQMTSAGNRPAGISNNDGYDIIPQSATAKNILTVGAVNSIPSGYAKAADVVLAGFSDWGPTDDGRIKPDVVANGVSVTSSFGGSDNAYSTLSGTSHSAPGVSGSAFLLQEHYSKVRGNFMRSATLKGLIIHTADEAGAAPGPDYQNGWGLVNTLKAAAVITSNNTDQRIFENNLANGASFSLPVVASGKGAIIATICWTDPKGTVDNVNRLNNRAKKLVNDLDIRIRRGGVVFQPWVLNVSNPSAAATRGDNTTDNVERIEISDLVPGELDTIIITHKGTLARGAQAYSLIVSGIGGQAYCASAPAANTGARIDNVTIGGSTFTSPAGCTSYTNNTATAIQAETLQPLPVSIRAGSCDGTSVAKTIKIFIDINNDGDFTDAGETLATGSIAGSATYTGSITVPAGLQAGSTTLIRIVLSETSVATDVNPCGSYARGETQDYRLAIAPPTSDVGASELVYPTAAGCANASQLVTVRIKNFGSTFKTNVPVTTTIRNTGGTTVATLSAVYPDTIAAFGDVVYTYQTPFNQLAGQTYTFTTTTSLAGDQISTNNQVSTSVVTGTSSAPSGSAEICGTNQVTLKANTTNTNDVPLWYSTEAATTPIASGANTSSNVITANKTYYLALNDINATVGPATKQAYTNGGYLLSSGNFVRFTNSVPVTIESVKLYIGFPGKITFTVADVFGFNAQTGAYSFLPISSTTINVYATTPTPQPGSVTGNNPADTGAVYYLNLPVPTAGEHVIIVNCNGQATIFRNNGLTSNPYPYAVSNVFSITGNSATNTADTTDTNFFQRFYYFFYNMKVKANNCPSTRIPVIATTTSVACPVTPVIDLNGTAIGLVVSPNPSRGQFRVQFDVQGRDNLNIDLINSLGQTVYRSNYPSFAGRFSQQISPGNLAPGIYVLKIQHNKKTFVKKLLVQ